MSNTKKQFYVTIPMMNPNPDKDKGQNGVVPLKYSFDGKIERGVTISRFPSIPLIKNCLKKDDDYEIIALWTDDVKEYSKINLDNFKKELLILGKDLGIDDLKVTNEIIIPQEESKNKQIQLFKQICNSFSNESEIYMDLTYGTKMSIINEFSTLAYAEKGLNCYVKEIIYGRYVFKGDEGMIFDVKCLYQMNALIQSISHIPNIELGDILNMFEVD